MLTLQSKRESSRERAREPALGTVHLARCALGCTVQAVYREALYNRSQGLCFSYVFIDVIDECAGCSGKTTMDRQRRSRRLATADTLGEVSNKLAGLQLSASAQCVRVGYVYHTEMEKHDTIGRKGSRTGSAGQFQLPLLVHLSTLQA